MITLPVNISLDPQLALTHVSAADVVAIDTETTGLFHRDSRLVGISFHAIGDSVAFYLPVYSTVNPPSQLVDLEVALDVVRAVLGHGHKTAVMHNAAFDLVMLRKAGVECRCQVFDTMLAAHRLDNTYKAMFAGGQQLSYKLKVLSGYLLGMQQQTWHSATQGLPAQMVPITQMAPYAAGDTYYTGLLYQHLDQRLIQHPGIDWVLRHIDFPIQTILAQMLRDGIPVDPTLCERHIEEGWVEYNRLTEQIAERIGLRVGKLTGRDLYRHLTGRFRVRLYPGQSLDKKNLRRIAARHDDPQLRDFIDLVLQRRKQATMIRSFFAPLRKRISTTQRRLYVGSMLQLTETGRFTSKDPNILALPKKGPVREIVTAPPGHVIVSMDYSNIEPRCLAQAMWQFLRDGNKRVEEAQQVNRMRARALLKNLPPRKFTKKYTKRQPLPLPQQSQLADHLLAGGKDPYKFTATRMFPGQRIIDDLRSKAKKLTLATMYGQGVGGIAREMDMSRDDAIELMTRFDSAVPELGVPRYQKVDGEWKKVEHQMLTYKDHIQGLIRYTGQVESLFGRIRKFPGLWHFGQHDRLKVIYSLKSGEYEFDVTPIQRWNFVLHCYVHGVTDRKTGKSIPWSHPVLSKPSITQPPYRQLAYKWIRRVITPAGEHIESTTLDDAYRQGFNAIFQMSAGDIFKMAILRVQPIIHKHDAQLLLNLHDELVFAVPSRNLRRFVVETRARMTQPPASWWRIPLMVDVQVGRRYGEHLRKYRWWRPIYYRIADIFHKDDNPHAPACTGATGN